MVQVSNRGCSRRIGGILDCTVIHLSYKETIHVSTETGDENSLKEDDRGAVEPTSPLPPPAQPTVPVNPCEG